MLERDGCVTIECGEDELVKELGIVVAAAVHGNCEGVMAKSLVGEGSHYTPGARSRDWTKLKDDYSGMAGGDSLDLVPIAA